MFQLALEMNQQNLRSFFILGLNSNSSMEKYTNPFLPLSKSNQKYQEPVYVSKNHFGEAISTHQRITKNRDQNLLVL
ncbi:hypothetical protein CASFOL_007834 [Castilleja foliolosa]|uniref:Uncharacterized protein n=1 Tax=Castilleja foliolosa TaxID=1961234 RepID=A0ABD3E1N5_9LAMI